MSYDRDNKDAEERADCDARDAHYLPEEKAHTDTPEHAEIRKEAHNLIDRIRTAIPRGSKREACIVALVALAGATAGDFPKGPEWCECVWNSALAKARERLKERSRHD